VYATAPRLFPHYILKYTYSPSGGPIIARSPDLVINAKIVNCPDYFKDTEDGLQ
jgi:hypothetical protein